MAKMTYDQYLRLPEGRNQYEPFDGELVITPSRSVGHQRIIGKLCTQLLPYVEAHSLGLLLVSPVDTIFDPYTVLQPDILFVSRERIPEVVKDRIEGAPDLTIEVLSSLTVEKDCRRKLAVYSQFGVREYWIVDPEAQTIELYAREGGPSHGDIGPQGGPLRLTRTFSAEEAFASPLFPGLGLPVASVF